MHNNRNFFLLSVKHNRTVLSVQEHSWALGFADVSYFYFPDPFSAAGGAFFFFFKLLPLLQLLLITVCHVVT